ncbi:MAG: hypothetical protein ACI9OJ_001178 [Myxococcota bacterium]|jgi:hypothetical protein
MGSGQHTAVNAREILNETAVIADAIAKRHLRELTDEDNEWLVTAFYRAEALAHAALVDAISQLNEPYLTPLTEQLEDEARHVDVFARWHTIPPEPVRPPASKQRNEPIWFTLLLINEVAGFCQFELLAGLVSDEVKHAEVAAVAADEVLHIIRLLDWLEHWRNQGSWMIVERMVNSFISKLEGRMTQFFPRDELGELRSALAGLVGKTLRRLLDPQIRPERPPV